MNGNILKLGFSHSSVGKESPAMQETLVRSLGWEYPLEQRKAKKKKNAGKYSSILAQRIPWTI